MADNSFGKLFTVTTFGESHGVAMGCIVDGCPAGLSLAEADIQQALNRRRPGQSAVTTPRQERDQVEILSGVFEGKTLGTPIGLCIRNEDMRSNDYANLKDTFRPGHADFTYQKKYGHRDHRGGGRASARETVNWVASGAIAQKYLTQMGVQIRGYLSQMGDIVCAPLDLDARYDNPFFCADPSQLGDLNALVETLRTAGDSVGAAITIVAEGVPMGLGEPVFNKLDAMLAQAMMGLNAVKAVEIGSGKACVTARGSAFRDEITAAGFSTNHAGGMLGGISNGEPIVVHIALKPTSSITTPIQSINQQGQEQVIAVTGRHDPCVGIRAVPVAEALMALVLMDLVLLARARAPLGMD